jgi:hypothetical protein
MKPLVIVLGIVSILFFILTVVYLVEPAKSLPTFMPGYNPSLARHHITHGIGTLFLGVGSFILAWFQSSAKKK